MAVTMPLFWMKSICRWKMDGLIVVEADDESALHLQAGPLDALHVFDQVAVPVLDLAALGQAVLVRGFDADEDLVEPGLDHQVHQRLVIGQVDGGLGEEQVSGLAPSATRSGPAADRSSGTACCR